MDQRMKDAIESANEELLNEFSDAIRERQMILRAEKSKEIVDRIRIGNWVRTSLNVIGKVILISEIAVTIQPESGRRKTLMCDEIAEIFQQKPEIASEEPVTEEEEEKKPETKKADEKKKGFGRK